MIRQEGVAAWVMDKRRHLLGGIRQGSHGAECWASPGGHGDEGESAGQTASRELLEETGLMVEPAAFVLFQSTEDDFSPEKRYVTRHCLAMLPPEAEGQVVPVLEPDKCRGWVWKAWWQVCDTPHLFLPTRNMLTHATAAALRPLDRWATRAALSCFGAAEEEEAEAAAAARGLCLEPAAALAAVEVRHAFGLLVTRVGSREELRRVSNLLASARIEVVAVVGGAETEAWCSEAGLVWVASFDGI